jgi:hypothetical protein
MTLTWVMAMVLAQAAPQGRTTDQTTEQASQQVLRATSDATQPATVDVRNQMGKRFRLIEARVSVDGLELARRTATAGQELEPTFRAYDGAIARGPHSVTVTLVYEGRNTGPFTYLDEYRYRVVSSTNIDAEESARPAALEIVAYERPGATVPVDQKPMAEIRAAPNSSVTPTRAVAPGLAGQ